MTNEKAKEYAKNMSYRDAVYNALQGRCIPYHKATIIKLCEMLDMIESQESEVKKWIIEWQKNMRRRSLYYTE